MQLQQALIRRQLATHRWQGQADGTQACQACGLVVPAQSGGLSLAPAFVPACPGAPAQTNSNS